MLQKYWASTVIFIGIWSQCTWVYTTHTHTHTHTRACAPTQWTFHIISSVITWKSRKFFFSWKQSFLYTQSNTVNRCRRCQQLFTVTDFHPRFVILDENLWVVVTVQSLLSLWCIWTKPSILVEAMGIIEVFSRWIGLFKRRVFVSGVLACNNVWTERQNRIVTSPIPTIRQLAEKTSGRWELLTGAHVAVVRAAPSLSPAS